MGATATTLQNNGHDIKVVMPEPNTYKTSMRGEMYTVGQCHFHWGSEHTINGQQAPLECHCVHTKDGVTEGRTHGVLAFFWQVGDAEDTFLSQFIEQVPSESPADGVKEEDVELSTPIDMTLLFDGVDLEHYWQYDGSLTTPPCSEVVDWQLVMSPRTLTQAQLDLIRTKIGSWDGEDRGNFREPQPLNGRTVLGCEAPPQEEVVWGYPENNQWTKVDEPENVCATGQEQSPIDLPQCDGHSSRREHPIAMGKGAHAWA